MHTFPAVFPVWVGEEAGKYFCIEVALAFEVAVKSAVCQAGSRHYLMERNIFKSVAIEELACAINDFSLYGGAVTSGVGHKGLLDSSSGKVCLEQQFLSSKTLSGTYFSGGLFCWES